MIVALICLAVFLAVKIPTRKIGVLSWVLAFLALIVTWVALGFTALAA